MRGQILSIDRELGKNERDAVIACLGCHFTGVPKEGVPILAHLLTNDLFALMRRDAWTIDEINQYREDLQGSLRELAMLRTLKLITSQQTKEVLEAVWDLPYLAVIDVILDRKMLIEIDHGTIEAAVSAILAANPEKLAEAKTNPKLVQWFMGQTLKVNKGMSAVLVKEALERQIIPDD